MKSSRFTLQHKLQRFRSQAVLKNLKIKRKLTLGFGSLVTITLLVVGLSYVAGKVASVNIERTEELGVPTVLASNSAQKNLLKMLSNIRAYLATGEPEYRYRYQQTRHSFEADLAQLEDLFGDRRSLAAQEQLEELQNTYREWLELPDRLIALQDNLLDNQPALKLLDEQGQKKIIIIQRQIAQMLDEQQGRSPSAANMLLLRNMANFQSSFSQAVSALQSYLVTRSPSFRFEYNSMAKENQIALQKLQGDRNTLSSSQDELLTEIQQQRQAFFTLPEQMFDVVDSKDYRQDLLLFQEQAEPLAETMLERLDRIVTEQQNTLTSELQTGSSRLNLAQWQTLLGGILAMAVGLVMVRLLQQQIADPIKRLTDVTGRFKDGDLDAKASEASNDEIGELAHSFNLMASQLKESFETLEDKVEERTAELASANEEITILNQKLKAENLRMGAELDVAKQLQQLVLPNPEELENIDGIEIAGFMEPADEVGGDYYDVLHTEGVVTIGIGDVTGHGLESGILMLMTQTAVRTLQEIRENDPIRFLDTLNRTIFRNVERMNSDKNLTLAILNYADSKVSISGQHEEAIVVRAGGKIELIDTMDLGLPIGIDDDISDFIDHTIINLNPGDGIVVYTDGIPEAFDMEKKQYGMERLCQTISKNWHLSAKEIERAIIEDVRIHIGKQKVFDDITLVILKQNDLSDTPKLEPQVTSVPLLELVD